MNPSRARLLLVLALTAAAGLYAAAETGTPYPAGTRVEVTTPAGTVTGTLADRTAPGWVLVAEPGRAQPTAIPDKSVAFIRADGATPAGRTARVEAAAKAAAADHFIHGQPQPTKPDRFRFRPPDATEPVPGVTVMRKFAFTLGHYDKHKTPAWVAMRWTRDGLATSEAQPSHPRPFRADPDLPAYARTGSDYQHDEFGYERGHMARHEDLSGLGAPGDPRRATRDGCLMSNIVPQQRKGHTVWGQLENEHRNIVDKPGADIGTVWVISGPVFRNGEAVEVIGPDRVGAPHAVYKVIGWQKQGSGFTARGYVIGQQDTRTDLTRYLTKIDDIEEATGLDFFPELERTAQDALEAKQFTTLWGDE